MPLLFHLREALYQLHADLRRSSAAERRTAAAIIAASVGVFICIIQHHFVFHPRFPIQSTEGQLIHRCGKCLLAALAWLLFESLNLAVETARWWQWRRWRTHA